MNEKFKKVHEEKPSANDGIIIVKGWDRKEESLKSVSGLEKRIGEMGFTLSDLVKVLTKEFIEGIPFERVDNEKGEVIEDVATEVLFVNGKSLDHLQVVAYPPLTNADLKEMTQFKTGGEVILVIDGAAELTYAKSVINGYIPRSSLQTEKVEDGDLIISTNTPNNWTKIMGEKFSFIYFVGNPNGPQKYGDVPKSKIPVK
jgi:hypothetical protein